MLPEYIKYAIDGVPKPDGLTPLGKIKKQKHLKNIGFDPKMHDPLLRSPDQILEKSADEGNNADLYIGMGAGGITGAGIGAMMGANRGEHTAYKKIHERNQILGYAPMRSEAKQKLTSPKYIDRLSKQLLKADGNATKFIDMFKSRNRIIGTVIGTGLGMGAGYMGIKGMRENAVEQHGVR